MKLTTMTLNALHCLVNRENVTEEEYKDGPPKEVIANFTYERVRNQYSIGKLGLRDVIDWLAEDGLELRDMPEPGRRSNIPQSRLKAAEELLKRYDYTVIKPNTN